MKVKDLILLYSALIFLGLGIFSTANATQDTEKLVTWVSEKVNRNSLYDIDDNSYILSSSFVTTVTNSYTIEGLPPEKSADLYEVDHILKSFPGKVRDKKFVAKISNGGTIKLELGKIYFLKNLPTTNDGYAVWFTPVNEN